MTTRPIKTARSTSIARCSGVAKTETEPASSVASITTGRARVRAAGVQPKSKHGRLSARSDSTDRDELERMADRPGVTARDSDTLSQDAAEIDENLLEISASDREIDPVADPTHSLKQ